MHSDAMSQTATRRKGSPSAFVKSRRRTSQRSARFVRLSQLRKLRDCEQVAAVCYRMRRGTVEFLLIQTRGSGRWTFPKGSTEPGLTHAQAAAMEAFEEAGVHGRIEEVSFASYSRQQRDRTKGLVKNDPEPVAVKAYLCQVFRLSVPKESNRNRTWFFFEEARESLKEGRNVAEGASLARVLRLAVERIQHLERESAIERESRGKGGEEIQSEKAAHSTDPLRTVKFEFADIYGRSGEGSARLQPERKAEAAQQYALPAAAIHRTETLRGDILEFDVSRKKRVKALGTGSTQK
jgi:8-oxo-dGTP pyrophosphatase MutT (NUDIX family)